MACEAVMALRDVGKINPAELGVVIGAMDNKCWKTITNACKMILKACNPTNRKKRRTTQTIKISKEEIAKSLVFKIIGALDNYEKNGESENEVVISFQMGTDFSKKNEQEIQTIHESLLKVGSNCNKIKLLSYCEMGRLYFYLKAQNQDHQNWQNKCASLKVSSNTVNRYMAFYDFCLSYPRILICGLTFETIMTYANQLITIFRKNIKLESRLMTPLKSISIKIEAVIEEESLPKNGDPLKKLSHSGNDKYNPGWEEEDVLRQDSDENDNTNSEDSDYIECEEGEGEHNDDDDNTSQNSN